MSRPTLEVADIFRTWAGPFVERSRARISWPQHKVMRANRAVPYGRARQTSRPLHPERRRSRLLV
jgi:hypothetical protein